MKPKTWIKCSVIILGVIIIPLLYSYFYLGAFWDPYNRLESVPVAVVNEDTGAEINGKTRNLGDEAVKKIIDDGTMKFTETSAADAESGVNGTKYYAVIKFPKDFSAKIATANEEDKQIATVTYSANMKHNYICSQIMKNAVLKIEEQSRDSVNKEITSTLVDKLNEVPNSLNTLDDGLTKLSDGATTLSDGTSKYVNAQGTLADALSQLKAGTSALYGGSSALHSGILALSDGVNKVADGTNQLKAGTQQLPALVSGVNQLGDGAKLLVAQTKYTGNKLTICDGITDLAKGLKEINSHFAETGDLFIGVKKLSDGADTLATKAAPLAALPAKTTELKTGTSTYVDGVDSTLYNLLVADDSATLNAKAMGCQTKIDALTAHPELSKDPVTDIKNLKSLQALYLTAAKDHNSYNQFKTDLAKHPLIAGGDTLKAGTTELATATANAGELINGITQIKSGANSLNYQFTNTDDTKTLKSGIATATAGAQLLESNYTGDYTKGVNQLADGMNTLVSKATELGKLSDGVDKLNAGATALTGGTQKLSNGSATLKSNLAAANGAVSQIANGNSQLADAANTINGGATELKDGLNTAKTGVDDKITEVNEQLKSTDGLAAFAEKPVEVKEEDINHLPNYGSAFAPYFMSLSLYVGALLIFFGIYLDADDRIKVLSRHSDNKIIRVMGFAGIGAAQAVALALICHYGLKLAISNIPAFYGSLILISLVFISIVEFLLVNLKDVGKFLSIAFLVLNLTSNGGTFPMETTPGLFRALYPWMPMTYSVNLLKEITVNFNGATARYNALVLLGIFVLFTSLTIIFSLTRKAKVKVNEILQQQN